MLDDNHLNEETIDIKHDDIAKMAFEANTLKNLETPQQHSQEVESN